jgi:hypothetical protein
MRNLSKPSQKIIQWIIIAGAVMSLLGVIVYRSWEAAPFALSVAIMSLVNVFKIRMLDRAVNRITEMDDPDIGKNYVKFQYLVRYFGTVIILLAIGLLYMYTPIPTSTVFGAIAGLFTMQIAVIIIRFMKFEEDSPPGTFSQENPPLESSESTTTEQEVLSQDGSLEESLAKTQGEENSE